MIRQKFRLVKEEWTVYVYYAVNSYYTHEIINRLRQIGCSDTELTNAYDNLSAGKLDTGLTYSNYEERKSVMVIALTSSPEEFAKSWHHEIGHLQVHISIADGINPEGEKAQYLGDDIVGATWDIAKLFLCQCCAKEKYKYVR